MQSFIAPDNHFAIFTLLLSASALGMYGERKGWFRNISGVLVTIFVAAILVTINFLPSATNSEITVPAYDFVFDYIVPFSIPLLLFNANLVKIVKESGRLVLIFLIGSLGVVLGAIIAFYVLNIGEEAYKLAGVFIGTYTGGSVNFIAVAGSLDFLESPLFASTIVVDNVFTNFFIMFLLLLPALKFLQKFYPNYEEEKEEISQKVIEKTTYTHASKMEKMAMALTIAGLTCALGFWLSPFIADALNTKINLELLLITLFIVALANLFPNQLEKLASAAFDLGMLLMFIFLATIGASCNLTEMISVAPGVLFFCIITLLVHFIVIMIGGKLLKISVRVMWKNGSFIINRQGFFAVIRNISKLKFHFKSILINALFVPSP